MKTHHIYWWNLENLFDIENSPDRPDWLQKTLKSELKGWTEAVLDKKISNLCSIIKQFNSNKGPDIMGICEVENKNVVAKLTSQLKAATNRDYNILHFDSPDPRGIDIAIFYDKKLYTDDGQVYTLEIMKRTATRELFQVHLKTKSGNELICIGNHWPSRSGGQYESEPFRIIVGETLSYWVDRIYEERGKDSNIVLMGDFNDNPFNRSIYEYMQTSNNRKVVINAANHYFYNPMFELLGSGMGTEVFGNEINIIDQVMVSKSIISDDASLPFVFKKASIIAFPEMVKGDYNAPIRYGRPSSASSYNPDGFSDHLPVELLLGER